MAPCSTRFARTHEGAAFRQQLWAWMLPHETMKPRRDRDAWSQIGPKGAGTVTRGRWREDRAKAGGDAGVESLVNSTAQTRAEPSVAQQCYGSLAQSLADRLHPDDHRCDGSVTPTPAARAQSRANRLVRSRDPHLTRTRHQCSGSPGSHAPCPVQRKHGRAAQPASSGRGQDRVARLLSGGSRRKLSTGY